MRELVRTNDSILVTAIEALLKGAGIPHLIADQNMSVLEGSVGILPRRVLVADECRATGGGIADAVISSLAEGGFRGPMGTVRAVDTYVPLAAAANLVLISDRQIVEAASGLFN